MRPLPRLTGLWSRRAHLPTADGGCAPVGSMDEGGEKAKQCGPQPVQESRGQQRLRGSLGILSWKLQGLLEGRKTTASADARAEPGAISMWMSTGWYWDPCRRKERASLIRCWFLYLAARLHQKWANSIRHGRHATPPGGSDLFAWPHTEQDAHISSFFRQG